MKNFNDFQNSENVLSKEQMNNVKGGTCQALDSKGRVWEGSKASIMYYYESYDFVRWCCDSCASASWAQ